MTNFRKAALTLVIFLLAAASLALAQGTYTQIDVPGSLSTSCWGIDALGDISGSYVDDGGFSHGFVLVGGAFTSISYPDVKETDIFGINDVGFAVGSGHNVANDSIIGFLYDIDTQTFTQITYPGGHVTTPVAINNAGTIAGYFYHGNMEEGFELKGSTYSKIEPAGATSAIAYGITMSGQIVGDASIKNTEVVFSFIPGTYRKITIPNLAGAVVTGIKPSGAAIIGSYSPSTDVVVGFVYENNTVTSLQFPGSNATDATGINDAGEVVGYFYDSAGFSHGFLWTPPASGATK